MKDKPFSLVGVNSDEVDVAKDAIARNNLNWRSFQNTVGGQPSISDDWTIEGWPTLVVLDAERRVRYRGHDGHAATDVAKRLVEEMATD